MADENQLAERLSDLQESYVDFLFEKLGESRYPSKQMMDRMESWLQNDEQFAQYVRYLLDRVGSDRYPSGELMDRIERMLAVR